MATWYWASCGVVVEGICGEVTEGYSSEMEENGDWIIIGLISIEGCKCRGHVLAEMQCFFASTISPTVGRKSIPRIGWETFVITKPRGNIALSLDQVLVVFNHVLMEETLTACRVWVVGRRWCWPEGTWITFIWTPVSFNNLMELDRSIM